MMPQSSCPLIPGPPPHGTPKDLLAEPRVSPMGEIIYALGRSPWGSPVNVPEDSIEDQ